VGGVGHLGMAITLYNPRTSGFVSFSVPVSDLPLSEMLLLNILIELRTQTEFLSSGREDDLDNIRTDIVST
jgi:hypothetical protein